MLNIFMNTIIFGYLNNPSKTIKVCFNFMYFWKKLDLKYNMIIFIFIKIDSNNKGL